MNTKKWWHVWSHRVFWPLLLLGAIFIIPRAARAGSAECMGALAFCFTATLIFVMSTLYHKNYDNTGLREKWSNADRIGIQLGIFGAICGFVAILPGVDWERTIWGFEYPWLVLFLSFMVLCLAILTQTVFGERAKKWSVRASVVMAVLFTTTLSLDPAKVFVTPMYFIAGGLVCEVIGFYFFLKKEPWTNHIIWHFLVGFGHISHYVGLWTALA